MRKKKKNKTVKAKQASPVMWSSAICLVLLCIILACIAVKSPELAAEVLIKIVETAGICIIVIAKEKSFWSVVWFFLFAVALLFLVFRCKVCRLLNSQLVD